jgi:hypothetical protein
MSTWAEVLEEMNRDLDLRLRAKREPIPLKEWLRRSRLRAAKPAVKSTEDEWKDISK